MKTKFRTSLFPKWLSRCSSNEEAKMEIITTYCNMHNHSNYLIIFLILPKNVIQMLLCIFLFIKIV